MRIQRGATTNIVVTVGELTTLSNPYYLFVFTNDTNTPVYALYNSAANTASADQQERFDAFNIVEVASGANPLTPTVTMPNGDYTYTIYQQASSTNIDPTLAYSIVEQGIVTVYSSTAPFPNKTYNPSITNKVYNG